MECYCDKCLYNIRAAHLCGYPTDNYYEVYISVNGECSTKREE